jgi:hypothetical protein
MFSYPKKLENIQAKPVFDKTHTAQAQSTSVKYSDFYITFVTSHLHKGASPPERLISVVEGLLLYVANQLRADCCEADIFFIKLYFKI